MKTQKKFLIRSSAASTRAPREELRPADDDRI